MSTIDLSIEKARRAESNFEITPKQLLRMVLDDLEKGVEKADGMMIILLKKGDGDWERSTYRSCLNRMEELAVLELSKDSLLERWARQKD